MSLVLCDVSYVTYHISLAICHMTHDTWYVSPTPTDTATDDPPLSSSPTMHSEMVHEVRTQKKIRETNLIPIYFSKPFKRFFLLLSIWAISSSTRRLRPSRFCLLSEGTDISIHPQTLRFINYIGPGANSVKINWCPWIFEWSRQWNIWQT